MKRTTTYAAALLLALATAGAVTLALPQVQPQQAQDTYTIEVWATWEGAAMPNHPADLTIVTSSGTYTAHQLPYPGEPYALEVEGELREWRLDGYWHLASGGISSSTTISAGLQLTGDAPEYRDGRYWQGDNVVDIVDYSRLMEWYGLAEECCDPRLFKQAAVDFSGGGVVDTADFSLLVRNYGRAGYELEP